MQTVTENKTLKTLEHLRTLYRQGYRSEVVDRALEKIVALEREEARETLTELEARLQVFEERYQMSSEEFYRRFRAGELGDDMDFVEWSVFYEMRKATQERLDLLTPEPV